ncbi:MAG: hypothetical protein FJW38_03030 [Acidobacteria bacterium]|nr:hypothetical protein [Acidobacteriota bacterium]
MHQLAFARVYDYSDQSDTVVVPVLLRSGTRQVNMAASVDTGASFCLFSAEVAEELGLDLTSGIRRLFRTANSGFEAYGHEVELITLGIATHALIYFFADPLIEKSVLGRIGWLDRVRVGLVHHDSKIYLSTYDAAS